MLFIYYESCILITNIYLGLEDQVNGCIDDEVILNTITMLLHDMRSIRHHLSLENKNKESEEV